MKSVWISEVVFLFLSVVDLEATSVPECACLKRNLTVTVDNYLRLYFDGIEITDLPNANNYTLTDVVELPCNTTLIAIHGRNFVNGSGILASTDDDYVLTNSSWKCSNISHSGWEEIGFDDSNWMSAVKRSRRSIPGISSNAEWIWLRQWISSDQKMDMEVYCRKRLAPSSHCAFGGICIDEPNGGYCICAPGYAGPNCTFDINECLLGFPHSECDPSMGKCIDFFGGYNCSCYEGYTNDRSKRCKASTKCNESTSLAILGFFFGVSVLVIIALISALWFLHLRKKAVKYEGMIDEGQIGVDNRIHQNNIAPGQNGVNNEIQLNDDAVDNTETDPAHYEYPGLRVFVQETN